MTATRWEAEAGLAATADEVSSPVSRSSGNLARTRAPKHKRPRPVGRNHLPGGGEGEKGSTTARMGTKRVGPKPCILVLGRRGKMKATYKTERRREGKRGFRSPPPGASSSAPPSLPPPARAESQ